jgi:ankyrin repeat protein
MRGVIRVRKAAAGLSAVALAVLLALPSLATARDVVEPIEKDAPVALAARANDGATVRALLDAKPRPDVNARTADGTSALHWAVYHNDVDLTW